MTNDKLNVIMRMTIAALLMGLSILLSRTISFYVALDGIPSIRIGFGAIPLVLASLICGPLWGTLAGAGADLIGAFAFPVGAYFYGYTIDSALEGLLPWLIMFVFRNKKKALITFDGVLMAIAVLSVLLYVYLTDEYGNGKATSKYHFDLTPLVRLIITATLLALAVISVVLTILLSRIGRTDKGQAYLKEKGKPNEGALAVSPSIELGLESGTVSVRPPFKPYCSPLEIYSIGLANGLFVSTLLRSYWALLYYGLPYGYSLFNSVASVFITLPLNTLLMILLVDPLTRIGAFNLGIKRKGKSYHS